MDKKPLKVVGLYQLHKTLGSGSMGKVKLALNMSTGLEFACKIIPRPIPSSEVDIQTLFHVHKPKPWTKQTMDESRIHKEISFALVLNHPHIVSLQDIILSRHHYYLFFQVYSFNSSLIFPSMFKVVNYWILLLLMEDLKNPLLVNSCVS